MNNLIKINKLIQELHSELGNYLDLTSQKELILEKEDLKNIKLIGKSKSTGEWWTFEYLEFARFELCIEKEFSQHAKYLSEIHKTLENGTLERLILVRKSSGENYINYEIEDELNTKIRYAY